MKKVVFALKGMYLGGTEKALLSALEVYTRNDYEVSILLLDKNGELLNDVPKFCKIKYIENLDDKIKRPLLRNGFKDNVKYYIKHLRFIKVAKILYRRIIKKDLLAEIDGKYKMIPNYNEEFDVAVSYQYHDTFMTRYVADRINAKRKYLWVHNDLSTTGFYYQYTYEYIENYNHIYSVSKYIENELKNAYPNIIDKISTKYNYFNRDKIILKSKENIDIPWNKNDFIILSVGRLNNQKGFDIAIDSAKILKNSNIKYKWYIIGDGEEKNNLQCLIDKNGLTENVILFGAVKNPFPYMENCNLYVQPSRHEGYCTTTKEALALCKPVISTNVSGSDEQIQNEMNGWIVNIDKNDIANKIIELYNNQYLFTKIQDNLKKVNNIANDDYFDFLDYEVD